MVRSLLLAIALIAFAVPAHAGDADGIDCKNAMVQRDLNICADKDYQVADKKLNAVYAKITAALGDENYKTKLKAAERAWMAYRDTECVFETAENEGGSIYPMEYSGCLTKLTNARTKQLQSYLECFKDADKCVGPQ